MKYNPLKRKKAPERDPKRFALWFVNLKKQCRNTGNFEVHDERGGLIALVTCKKWGYGATASPQETQINAVMVGYAPQLYNAAADLLNDYENGVGIISDRGERFSEASLRIREILKCINIDLGTYGKR